ncbi:protease inhibitor Inh/omp19 family protein [Ancylobacter sp. A5.8]|uniref:protease inhibitor Inh/omp19 family protein n=1 Tax=Ancylobacter gelatini TaxID=2919920 RepID=UPI001F4D7F83|nr:protease inhibitor Inh/omp19 family protein [Ancylobacter gelatini]MCJ8144828.1 protease inhibitor Inh/omp19 family protein [Ancylobacter gelatini]
MKLLLAGLLALAAMPQASAQSQPSATDDAHLVGDYQLASADGMRACPIMLSPRDLRARDTDAANFREANIHEATLDRAACAQMIAFSADIAGWSMGPGNAIRLHDARGSLVAEFTEGVGGTWEALRERDGVYFLVNPRLADPVEQARPDDMFGLWDVARAYGRPVCRIRLSDATVRQGAYRLDPDGGCRLLFGRFMPDRWRIERGDLVLESAAGVALRFASNEEGGFTKVPEDNRPLFLSRVR